MTRPSLPVAEDLRVADLQTAVLLTSLAEQHGNTLGPTATIALRHAARRLWELWNEDGAGGDGPLSVGATEENHSPPSPAVEPDPTTMFQ